MSQDYRITDKAERASNPLNLKTLNSFMGAGYTFLNEIYLHAVSDILPAKTLASYCRLVDKIWSTISAYQQTTLKGSQVTKVHDE